MAKRSDIATEEIDRITDKLEYLGRLIDDAEGRFERSVLVGTALADAVRYYLENPEAAGSNTLSVALKGWMQQHSANFNPTLVTT